MDPVTLDSDVAARLVAAGQRYTPHRRALIGALGRLGRPASVVEVVAACGDVPVSTAYRNLAVLVSAGVVDRVAGPDDNTRFELAEDVTGHHHHHLVCNRCGVVTDVVADSRLERALAAAAEHAASQSGFRSVEHRIDLVGVCGSCA